MARGSSPENPDQRVFMILLVYCIVSTFYDVSVLTPALRGIFLISVARYSLFVLKVPLNTNEPNRIWVSIISGTVERNDCVSFRILQEYDNLRNGTAERTVIGRNGTLILTLCLTLP